MEEDELQPPLLSQEQQEDVVINDYIRAVNIHKRYDHNNPVLNGLNINICKGKIYALLGPSGCGKTTLLKCLIGLLPIDSGDITIFSKTTNQIKNSFRIDLSDLGFMPQDACLYDDLTISEIFYYFAKLHNIQNEQIKKREEFLINLLNLPKKYKLIKYLSTGQLRRVSFACCLIHEPSILILDEPTVALDPILRKKIWDYLMELSSSKQTTIIITTHYIDEARYANSVGFMRNGKIIEENNPNYLMQKYKENVLEDVFYKICIDDDGSSNTKILNNIQYESNSQSDTSSSLISKLRELKTRTKFVYKALCYKNRLKISMDHLNALLYKDTIKCKRNKSLLFIQLIIPIIVITLFCTCIGKTPKNLNIGYVNLNTNEENNFIDIGGQIVDELDEDLFIKNKFNTFDEGYLKLLSGDIWGLIKIDKNFSFEIMDRISKNNLTEMKFNNQIHIYLDNTNHQISFTIQNGIFSAIKSVLDIFIVKHDEHDEDDNDVDYNKFYYPLVYEKPVYGSDAAVFTHFMAPGIAITVIFFLSVAATASNFVHESRLGLVERSYLSGIRTIELLISQIIVYSVLLILQIAIVLILLFLVFKLPLRGSLSLLVILIYLQGFSGLTYGLFVSAICNTEESVIQLTLASFYPILLMSGIIWPIESQPPFLAKISNLLPLTYATEAFRLVLEKGWNLFAFKVLLGFLSTFTWIFIFSTGFIVLFSLKNF